VSGADPIQQREGFNRLLSDLLAHSADTVLVENASILATMQPKKSIKISTISDLGQNHMTLGLYCGACDRWAEIMPGGWGRPPSTFSGAGESVRNHVQAPAAIWVKLWAGRNINSHYPFISMD
jgi:hypothetical protein